MVKPYIYACKDNPNCYSDYLETTTKEPLADIPLRRADAATSLRAAVIDTAGQWCAAPHFDRQALSDYDGDGYLDFPLDAVTCGGQPIAGLKELLINAAPQQLRRWQLTEYIQTIPHKAPVTPAWSFPFPRDDHHAARNFFRTSFTDAYFADPTIRTEPSVRRKLADTLGRYLQEMAAHSEEVIHPDHIPTDPDTSVGTHFAKTTTDLPLWNCTVYSHQALYLLARLTFQGAPVFSFVQYDIEYEDPDKTGHRVLEATSHVPGVPSLLISNNTVEAMVRQTNILETTDASAPSPLLIEVPFEFHMYGTLASNLNAGRIRLTAQVFRDGQWHPAIAPQRYAEFHWHFETGQKVYGSHQLLSTLHAAHGMYTPSWNTFAATADALWDHAMYSPDARDGLPYFDGLITKEMHLPFAFRSAVQPGKRERAALFLESIIARLMILTRHHAYDLMRTSEHPTNPVLRGTLLFIENTMADLAASFEFWEYVQSVQLAWTEHDVTALQWLTTYGLTEHPERQRYFMPLLPLLVDAHENPSSDALDTYVDQVAALTRTTQWDHVATMARIITLFPENAAQPLLRSLHYRPALLAMLGMELIGTRHVKRGGTLLLDAVALDPTNVHIACEAVRFLMANGDTATARQIYDHYAGPPPVTMHDHYLYGVMASLVGDNEKALALLNAVEAPPLRTSLEDAIPAPDFLRTRHGQTYHRYDIHPIELALSQHRSALLLLHEYSLKLEAMDRQYEAMTTAETIAISEQDHDYLAALAAKRSIVAQAARHLRTSINDREAINEASAATLAIAVQAAEICNQRQDFLYDNSECHIALPFTIRSHILYHTWRIYTAVDMPDEANTIYRSLKEYDPLRQRLEKDPTARPHTFTRPDRWAVRQQYTATRSD